MLIYIKSYYGKIYKVLYVYVICIIIFEICFFNIFYINVLRIDNLYKMNIDLVKLFLYLFF